MWMSDRDPYPFPTMQNDNNFVGHRETQKQPYSQPAHLAQKTEPWNRLYNQCTLASRRREVFHQDPKAPLDSLDFVLKADYDQHREFLKGNSETLVQPETLGRQHGRILKNREIIIPVPVPENGHPLKISEVPKKENINSVDNNIDGPHTQITNQGYIRKPDGGFFTS